MADLFAKKPLNVIMQEAEEGGEHSLRRALGPTNLITLGIGAIIGTGIFVLTGTASAMHAGPAIVWSFVLAGVGCVFAGLCYAEFASMIPVAGSAYTYGYATLGEFIAWIIGWDLVLEYALGAATVASGWSGYVLSLLGDLGIRVSPKLAGAPGTQFVLYHDHWERLAGIARKLAVQGIDPSTLPTTTSSFNLFGFLGILLVTIILVIGIKESANFNSAIVIIKVCVLLVFIGLGANYILGHRADAVTNWTPFIPPNTGGYGNFGMSGIAAAAAIIFFAYIGFDAVSTAAQEAKNPGRDMPIGILGSLVICTILYILTAGVLTGLVKYTNLNVPDPIAIGIDVTGVRWGSMLVKIGAICGLSSTMVVMLLGQSRVFFSMSRDGLLPSWASKIHPRFRTPYLSTIFVGFLVALAGALTPIDILGEMVSIGTLLAFVIVSAGVWSLRVKKGHVVAVGIIELIGIALIALLPALRVPQSLAILLGLAIVTALVWKLRAQGGPINRVFVTPLIPFTPIMAIVISLYMMVSLQPVTWTRLVVWLVIGLIIYFGYSRKKSKVQQGRPEAVLQPSGD